MPIIVIFPNGREIHLIGENLDDLELNSLRKFITGMTRGSERPVRINKEAIAMAQHIPEAKLREIEEKQKEAEKEQAETRQLARPRMVTPAIPSSRR